MFWKKSQVDKSNLRLATNSFSAISASSDAGEFFGDKTKQTTLTSPIKELVN